MSLLSLLLGSALALDLELPGGESPEAWLEALEHAGVGADREGGVQLLASADSWTLVVTRPDGQVRRMAVDPPRSATDRDEIAALASSLLSPMRVALPTLPPEAEPEAPPRPRPAPPPAPEPEVQPEPEAVAEAVVVAQPELLEAPPEQAPPWSLATGLRARARQTPGLDLELRRELLEGAPLRLELAAGLAPWTRVRTESGLVAGSTELRAGPRVVVDFGRAELALSAGLAARHFRPRDWEAAWVAVPVASGELCLELREGLGAYAAFDGDLRLIQLGTEDGADELFAPAGGRIGLTVDFSVIR